MQSKLRFIAIACSFLLLTVATGCASFLKLNDTTTEETYPNLTKGEILTLYDSAVNTIANTSSLSYTVSTQKMTTVGVSAFSESSTQKHTYVDFEEPSMQAMLEETLSIGNQTHTFAEYYQDSMVYYTVNGHAFRGSVTQELFLAQHIPCVILDVSLYQQIITGSSSNGFSINFRQPTIAENWALPKDAELIEAYGSALISLDGKLEKSTYHVSYQIGAAIIDYSVTVSPSTSLITKIEIPNDPTDYILLEDPYAPRLLEQACSHILQADSISAESTVASISEANSIFHSQTTSLDLSLINNSLSSNLDTVVNAIDYSRGVNTTNHKQTEHFKNNTYTISSNGTKPKVDNSIDAQQMLSYCQDLLVKNVILPNHIANAKISDLGNAYLLEFTGTEELAQIIKSNTCQTLYQDSELLNSLASSYETTQMDCYLSVDKNTGLPVAAGLRYSGTHIIENVPYALTTQADLSYFLGSQTTPEAHSSELESDSDTSVISPLFYHVTGEDDQSMWILGTTPGGDKKTANIPAKILEALRHADKIVMESRISETDFQISDNPQIFSEPADILYYTDGTQTSDHLDPELYEAALRILKSTGNYRIDSNYQKPIYWVHRILDSYVRQGYLLTAEQGILPRLIQFANQNGKEILEININLLQAESLEYDSDELQEMILQRAITLDAELYNHKLLELYSAWCVGDELMLNNALSDFSSSEPLMKEELMSTIRKESQSLVFETAKTCLQSGETAFLAVNVQYLFAEDGLISSLQDAGYTVSKVAYQ